MGAIGNRSQQYRRPAWRAVTARLPGLRSACWPAFCHVCLRFLSMGGNNMDMTRRAAAEFFGTFWLTFAGCGAAVLAAGFPALGIGFLGVAFAFGLTVLTMAYAVGHISGGHFNPAVTVGLWAGGRCSSAHVV